MTASRTRLHAAQTVGLACCILLSALVGIGLGGAQADMTTIDADHDLATEQAAAEFQQAGRVTTNVPQADLQVTVAAEHDGVDLGGPRIDARHTYLRLDYDEDIARTVRIYLPADMVAPRVKDGLEPVGEGPTADLRPTENRTYQAVTVRLDGETDVTYALSREAGAVSSARDWVREQVGNVTGVSVPSIGSGGQWEYLEPSEYGPNRSVSLDGNGSWTVQRETTREGETEWLPVPECDDIGDQAACYYETANATIIMSTQQDPPRIRYKRGTDPTSSLGSAINDLLAIPGRIMEDIREVFG